MRVYSCKLQSRFFIILTNNFAVAKLKKNLFKRYSGDNFKPDNILFGNGSKELLYIVQNVFDGIIIHITPSWVSYKNQLSISNNLHKLKTIKTFFKHNKPNF